MEFIEGASIVIDGPLEGRITFENTGVVLKALSLLKGNPIQLKLSSEEFELLQILNESELLITIKIVSKDSENPFYSTGLQKGDAGVYSILHITLSYR